MKGPPLNPGCRPPPDFRTPPKPTVNAPYETVGARKFLWMSLLTLTLYDVYWVYRTWKRIRMRTGESFSPFWRTFLAPFTCFGLFARIHRQAREQGLQPRWHPDVLAIAYLVLSFAWLVPSPWVLVSFAGFVPFVPVVATTRALNARSGSTEEANDHFTGGNVAGMIVGGAVLVMLVVLTVMGY
jgi:hypothetical protein